MNHSLNQHVCVFLFPHFDHFKRSTKSTTLEFHILFPAPQKQNRGHPSWGGPAERSHRMLLSQAEKKVASMARELDALTAFERRSFSPYDLGGWLGKEGSGGRGVVNWD